MIQLAYDHVCSVRTLQSHLQTSSFPSFSSPQGKSRPSRALFKKHWLIHNQRSSQYPLPPPIISFLAKSSSFPSDQLPHHCLSVPAPNPGKNAPLFFSVTLLHHIWLPSKIAWCFCWLYYTLLASPATLYSGWQVQCPFCACALQVGAEMSESEWNRCEWSWAALSSAEWTGWNAELHWGRFLNFLKNPGMGTQMTRENGQNF